MNKLRLSLCAPCTVAALIAAGCGGSNSSEAPNQAPVISAAAGVTVDEDMVLPVSFTVNDRETPPANLTVKVTSSDPTIVPTANAVLGGGGSNRTVTLTPLPDVVGTTTITLTVTDAGGLSASASIPVTFREVRLDFYAYSRQAFQVPANGTAVTLTREKFNFNGDTDFTFFNYKDLIGP
jgi:hypothetical protein